MYSCLSGDSAFVRFAHWQQILLVVYLAGRHDGFTYSGLKNVAWFVCWLFLQVPGVSHELSGTNIAPQHAVEVPQDEHSLDATESSFTCLYDADKFH